MSRAPGDVTSRTAPDHQTTRYGYDTYGDLISTVDATGRTFTSTYNDNRPEDVIDNPCR